MTDTHKGWYSRGYLPHFDAAGLVQGLTFRLHDALPAHVVEMLMMTESQESDAKTRRAFEHYLNMGYGACYLRQPRIAELVQDTLHYFDGVRYRLIAWVVMPNHVHTIIEHFEGHPLRSIVHSWKSFTANEANDILGRDGPFWFREYFDRYIRNERHLINAIRYVHDNPVKAGLVQAPEDWPYSSARLYKQLEEDTIRSAGILPALPPGWWRSTT